MTTIRQLRFIFLGTPLLWCFFQTFRVNAFECGKVQLTRETVLGGNDTLKGEWPSIAALYERSSNAYICGGTLISEKHVLTAAHCIHKRHSSVKRLPDDLEVRLGAYNLSAINEKGSIRKNVTEIFVHHDWRTETEDYDADVAILVFNGNIAFSNFIQPICMPADDIVIDGATVDVKGTVVGWGLSNTTYKHEETPKKIIVNAVNNSYCYRNDPGIVGVSSQRTFCGKSDVGTPNKGDSGSGFLVVSMTSWMQYGIVSGIRTNWTGQATPNSFTVYTNVKPFKQWILNVVKQSGGEVGELTHKVNLSCPPYVYSTEYGYECRNSTIRIDQASVTGAHLLKNTLGEVQVLYFTNGYMLAWWSNGFGRYFRNITNLKVNKSHSSSYTTCSSLKNLENLTEIFIYGNNVENLEEDCLWDLKNLTTLYLIDNRITALLDRFLERNDGLADVVIVGNRLQFLPVRLFEHKSKLETLSLARNSLLRIDGMMFATNTKLKKVDLSSNKLEYLPGNLFEQNLLLQEIQLGENSIRVIGENIFQANVNLAHVNLSHNYLESLNAKIFKNNSILQDVILDKNLLSTMDENIFDQNLNLSAVTLSSNPLETITPNLFKVNTKMKLLLLSDMSLTTIDENIFERMPELRAIDISFNQIGTVPKNLFKNNTLLEVIFLTNISMKTVDEETFKTNTNLQTVNLSGNKLESLPGKLFEKNPFLRRINLGYNALKEIDEQIFERNEKLVFVSFASNKLESLPRNLFKNNLLLEKADFRHNSLRFIDTNFSGLDNVQAISFHNNICISTAYFRYSNVTSSRTNNFTDFQNIVNSFCRFSVR